MYIQYVHKALALALVLTTQARLHGPIAPSLVNQVTSWASLVKTIWYVLYVCFG